MTHMTDQERAEFEVWANGRCELYLVNPAGRYLSAITQFAWEAWQSARRAKVVPQVEVTDCMALAFHNAVTDGPIGEDDFNDIKTGLHAALAAAPEKPNFDASKLQKLLERLQLVTDEGPPDEGWKSTALEEGIAELERMLAAEPQPPEADHQDGAPEAHAIAKAAVYASLATYRRVMEKRAAPVQMPEPEALVESKLGTVCMFQSSNMRKGDKIYTEHQVRQLLAAKEPST